MASKYSKPCRAFSMQEICSCIEGQPSKDADLNYLIQDIVDLQSASKNDISFLSNPKYLKQAQQTQAYALIVSQKDAEKLPEKLNLVVVSNAYLAFAKVVNLFYPPSKPVGGIHSNAFIHPEAKVHPTCSIAPGAYIGQNVILEENVVVGPNAVLLCDVYVGANTVISGLASIKYCELGKNCYIYEGAKIGQDGFGFVPNYKDRHVKIPQVGSVIIGDDVEIGANTCIDRGAIKDTVIKSGTKIDNLVQIGHNVELGENCFVGGQSGISGSATIHNNVAIAGQSGLGPHITVGENAQMAPKTGVFRDVPPNTTILGSPARNFYEALRLEGILNKLLKEGRK